MIRDERVKCSIDYGLDDERIEWTGNLGIDHTNGSDTVRDEQRELR